MSSSDSLPSDVGISPPSRSSDCCRAALIEPRAEPSAPSLYHSPCVSRKNIGASERRSIWLPSSEKKW